MEELHRQEYDEYLATCMLQCGTNDYKFYNFLLRHFCEQRTGETFEERSGF